MKRNTNSNEELVMVLSFNPKRNSYSYSANESQMYGYPSVLVKHPEENSIDTIEGVSGYSSSNPYYGLHQSQLWFYVFPDVVHTKYHSSLTFSFVSMDIQREVQALAIAAQLRKIRIAMLRITDKEGDIESDDCIEKFIRYCRVLKITKFYERIDQNYYTGEVTAYKQFTLAETRTKLTEWLTVAKGEAL